MGWARSLTTTKDVVPAGKKLYAERAQASSNRFGALDSLRYGRENWELKKSVRDGMERIVWVYRCVESIASAQSDLTILFRDGDKKKGQPVPNHDLDFPLNSQANPGEDAWAFRFRLSCQLLLSKKGAFVEKLYDKSGAIMGFALLPPDQITIIPDTAPGKFVKSYRLQLMGEDDIDIPPEDVIWVRKPHPLDPYKAITPMQAAGIAVDTDYLARVYNRQFLLNDGRPGGIIVVKGDGGMEDTDIEELKSRFAGNINRAGRVSVLEAEGGVEFVDTAINPRDAQWKDMRGLNKDELLLAFGVPESVMGNASGRTYDNAEAEDLVFWEKTMFGHNGIIARAFDQLDDDPKHFCGYDYSDVPALVAATERRTKVLRDEVDAGLRSINEYRVHVGLDPIPVGGDRLWHPGTMKEFADTQDELYEPPKPVAPPTPFGALPPGKPGDSPAIGSGDGTSPDDVGNPNNPDSSGVDAVPAKVGQARIWNGEVYLPVKMLEGVKIEQEQQNEDIPDAVLVNPWAITKDEWSDHLRKVEDLRAEHADIFTTMIRRYFKRQHKVVVAKLRGAKCRKLVAAGRKISEDDIYNQDTWDGQLRDDAHPVIAGTMTAFGVIVAARAGGSYDPEADGVAERQATQLDRTVLINQTTGDRIGSVLAAGGTNEEMAVRIDDLYASWDEERAFEIGDSETLAAANAGLLEAADQSNVAEEKVWVATADDRTRDTHLDADGQIVPMDEQFDVGGESMDFPGDPSADAAETANCRCTMYFGSTDPSDPNAGDLSTEGDAGEGA